MKNGKKKAKPNLIFIGMGLFYMILGVKNPAFYPFGLILFILGLPRKSMSKRF